MKTEKLFQCVLLAGLVASIASTAAAYCRATSTGDWIYRLIWTAMLLHQCEENVLTELALGRRFAFLRWVRTVGYEIPAARALQLNVLVGWTLAWSAAYCGDGFVVVPLFVAAVETVNGFWHLSVTALQRRWSPGTLTSVVSTIPLGLALFHFALEQRLVTAPICYALFLAACASHHLFLSSLPRVAAGVRSLEPRRYEISGNTNPSRYLRVNN